jgi:NADPH:quinone reductase-like Zn-dependent oxidoreductase
MNQLIEAKQLRPVIDRVFPFEQAADALRYLEAAGHFGKVVISL